MGFIPIGTLLDVQLSARICTPRDKQGRGAKVPKGYRFEITDARMVRATWHGDAYSAKHKTFREAHPRWGEAEIGIDGVPFLHHTPIRHRRSNFFNTGERGGVNTRVTIIDERQPDTRLSRNALENEAGGKDLRISEENWRRVVPQLRGFTEAELQIIKRQELLWPLPEKIERNFALLGKIMRYAWETTRLHYD